MCFKSLSVLAVEQRVACASCEAASVESFPHPRTMDRYIGIDLEAQFHVRTVNTKHRAFEQAMKTIAGTAKNMGIEIVE